MDRREALVDLLLAGAGMLRADELLGALTRGVDRYVVVRIDRARYLSVDTEDQQRTWLLQAAALDGGRYPLERSGAVWVERGRLVGADAGSATAEFALNSVDDAIRLTRRADGREWILGARVREGARDDLPIVALLALEAGGFLLVDTAGAVTKVAASPALDGRYPVAAGGSLEVRDGRAVGLAVEAIHRGPAGP